MRTLGIGLDDDDDDYDIDEDEKDNETDSESLPDTIAHVKFKEDLNSYKQKIQPEVVVKNVSPGGAPSQSSTKQKLERPPPKLNPR